MKAWWNALQSTIMSHFKLTLARPTFQITLIAQPLVMATISYMIFRKSGTMSLLQYTVLGSGISGIWSSIVFSSAGDINRERFYGTLQPLLLSSTPILAIMLGKILANGLLSSFSMVISLIYGTFVLQIPLTLHHPGIFILALIALLISTNLFALLLSSLFLLSRSTTVMQNFLEYPMLIISGVFFPISILPDWLQPLAWTLPLQWGAQAMQLSLQPGQLTPNFGWIMIILLGLGGLYLVLSTQTFRWMEKRVQVQATLDIY